MKYSSFLFIAGLAAAATTKIPRPPGCLDDNCMRAVKNAQRPGLADCISYSSAVLAASPVTVTVTSTSYDPVATTPAAGIPETEDQKRDFIPGDEFGILRRDVALPPYAFTQCKGSVSRYISACSCIQIYSATTVTIPPVTTTKTEGLVIPTTITGPGPAFKISFAKEGVEQYLFKGSDAVDVLFPAEFTSNEFGASILETDAEGNIVESVDKSILVCDKSVEEEGEFKCWFVAPEDLESVSELEEPLRCTRSGGTLHCAIAGKDTLAWISEGLESRKRQEESLSLGIFQDEAALQAFIQENPGAAGAADLGAAFILPSNSTTTAAPPSSTLP